MYYYNAYIFVYRTIHLLSYYVAHKREYMQPDFGKPFLFAHSWISRNTDLKYLKYL